MARRLSHQLRQGLHLTLIQRRLSDVLVQHAQGCVVLGSDVAILQLRQQPCSGRVYTQSLGRDAGLRLLPLLLPLPLPLLPPRLLLPAAGQAFPSLWRKTNAMSSRNDGIKRGPAAQCGSPR